MLDMTVALYVVGRYFVVDSHYVVVSSRVKLR
jgi:hypothetical protein